MTRVTGPPITFVLPFSTLVPFAKSTSKRSLKSRSFQDAKRTMVRAITYVRSSAGMVSVEDSCRILRTIFPNYPELKPCNPTPMLEPIAPSPAKKPFEIEVA